MNRRMRRSPTLALAEAISAARRRGEKVYSLSTPTFSERQVKFPADARKLTTLTDSLGMPELRETAQEKLLAKWDLPQHECMISGGAKAAIFCILRSMLPAGAKVMIISPHWPSYEDLVRLARLKPVFHNTQASSGFALDANRLRRDIADSGAGAVICSNPGNPTGRVFSGSEAAVLCDAAAAGGAILLLDESFSGIVFDADKWQGSVCPPDGGLFVVSSFSKSFHLQGLRLGVCLVHRDHAAEVAAAHQTLLSAAPTASQAVACGILGTPGTAPEDYSEQRRLMLSFAAARGWPHLATEGGFYLFPRVPEQEALRRALESKGLLALPGETFGADYRDHLRMCFGKPVAELHAILRILDSAIREQPGQMRAN